MSLEILAAWALLAVGAYFIAKMIINVIAFSVAFYIAYDIEGKRSDAKRRKGKS